MRLVSQVSGPEPYKWHRHSVSLTGLHNVLTDARALLLLHHTSTAMSAFFVSALQEDIYGALSEEMPFGLCYDESTKLMKLKAMKRAMLRSL